MATKLEGGVVEWPKSKISGFVNDFLQTIFFAASRQNDYKTRGFLANGREVVVWNCSDLN